MFENEILDIGGFLAKPFGANTNITWGMVITIFLIIVFLVKVYGKK
jgi:hypothetical protein